MDRAAGQHWMVVEVLQMDLMDEKEVLGIPSHVRDHPFEMKVVHEELPSQGPCSLALALAQPRPHPAPQSPKLGDQLEDFQNVPEIYRDFPSIGHTECEAGSGLVVLWFRPERYGINGWLRQPNAEFQPAVVAEHEQRHD
jgi:hypothetical protein